MKKFNGHRCERRNLTDLVLGTGPDGKKRAQPKAKKRPKNYTDEPAVNKMYTGGPLENYNLGNVQFTGSAGQMPGQISQFLQEGNNANLVSAGGQAFGTMIANESAGDHPTDGYKFGEGAGDFIAGATNPLAMSLGPWGMLAFGVGNVAKGIYEEKRDLKEYREQQQKDRDKRIALNAQAAQNFSNQAMSTYDQAGTGGSFYRHGGHLMKYYYGGPGPTTANPPAVMPGMEQYAQYANLNPALANAVSNVPVKNDRLTSYTDAELARYEANAKAAADNARYEQYKDTAQLVATNPTVAMDAVQLGLGAVQTSEIPVFSQAAGVINTLGYGSRAAASYIGGDTLAGGMYTGLAGLSAAGTLPVAGTAADASVLATQAANFSKGLKSASNIEAGLEVANTARTATTASKVIHGLEAAEHVVHPMASLDKAVNVGTGGQYKPSYVMMGHRYGGRPQYETEKSEVILASPGDKPIAMGQGGYTKLSQNLYKGNGPSHEQGGIPTSGGTKQFIDNTGQANSPYVFSDDKAMRFDATNILSMIR